MLAGIRVVDLTGESGALAARVLADLGAEVIRPEPPDGGHFRDQPHHHAAWTARSRDPADGGRRSRHGRRLLADADVVLATRGHGIETERAPKRGLGPPLPLRPDRAPGRLAGR